LLTDSSVQRAFDVHNAEPQVLDRYGRNAFGWSLLMARQLVRSRRQSGSGEPGQQRDLGYHDNNFPLLRDCCCRPPTVASRHCSMTCKRGVCSTKR